MLIGCRWHSEALDPFNWSNSMYDQTIQLSGYALNKFSLPIIWENICFSMVLGIIVMQVAASWLPLDEARQLARSSLTFACEYTLSYIPDYCECLRTVANDWIRTSNCCE